MKFSEQLQLYMTELGVSSRELAREAGISESALSRYRSGERTPSSDEERLHRLADALIRTATVSDIPYSGEEIFRNFNGILGRGLLVPYEVYLDNLHQLLEVMGIRSNELAKELSFDPSYISRILSGKRRPAELRSFNTQVVSLICRKSREQGLNGILAELLRISADQFTDEEQREAAVLNWLGSNAEKDAARPIRHFLREMDGFSLDDYSREVRLDEFRAPATTRVNLPKRKICFGMASLMEAELEFLRMSAANRSEEPVFLFSDISVLDKARDPDFRRRWMLGVLAILRRGLRIRIIHDMNRPMPEMFLVLETIIPLIMTGQIDSYYLLRHHGDVFSHKLWISGSVVLMGEALSGYPREGMYTLTNHTAELRYAKKRAKRLLEQSAPLMQIYRDEERIRLLKDEKDIYLRGSRRLLCSFLPITALTDQEIDRYLERAGLEPEWRAAIQKRVEYRKKMMAALLREYHMRLDIPNLTEEEFKKRPVSLTFADIGKDIVVDYSYEEYWAHLEATKRMGEEYKNLEIVTGPGLSLRNVNLQLVFGQSVILSKSHAPLVCFVIKHPNLVRTIEEFISNRSDGRGRKDET